MEKFYIENKSHSDINNELKNDFKKYESKQKDYGEELNDLGHSYLKKYQSKINDAVKKIENIQQVDKNKFSEHYNDLGKRLKDTKNEIDNKTIKLNLGYIAYKKHHNEHINALGAAIDNYENEALSTINNLIDAINDDQQIQLEKTNVDNANKRRNYVEIDSNGIYRLTKNTNKPRIDQVLGTVIKEGELRKIDYSQCTNQSIKNRMASAISSNSKYDQASSNRLSCYLQYDKQRKTYLISDGQGNILPQRALIWEGVQLTPPSKIKGEAKLAQTEQRKAIVQEANRTDLKDTEKQQLQDSMPKKLKEAIPSECLDEFFQKTEKDINSRIQNAKYLGYELAAQPISKVGHTKNGKLLEIHLINGQSETKENLITTQLSEPLFKALDSHETELVQYMTMRVVTKWGKFDYLTKRENVITHRETNNGKNISEEQKNFTTYGLGLLSQRADNVFDKIGNTKNKNDRKFVSLKKYINDSLYSLEHSNNTTQDDLNDILKRLCGLMPVNISDINNLLKNILGMNTNWSNLENQSDINERQQEYQKLQSSAKATAIDSIRKIGNSRTLFDNADTTFLRDEIISDIDEENVDMENDDYEKYFKKIYELYSLPEPNLAEGEEFDVNKIIDSKASEIDELYESAQGNEDKFLNFLIDKGLLPNKAHDKKLKEKVKELKASLNQQENAAKNFEITGNELRDRFKSEQSNLQLKSNLNDEERKRLNELDFLLAQDNNFFDSIAEEETKKTQKIIQYVGIESTIKAKIAPYLIQKGGGIKGINNSDIYNDSVGAGGWFERSDENCAKIGPKLKELIVEVIITAVSIALSWNGAGEAIYGAFRAAKLVAQTAKGIQKVIKFMAAFSKALAKRMATQYAGKFTAKAAKAAKSIGSISKISLSTVVKGGETFGSLATKLAMKGTSMIIEGTTFHISNTIIQNAVRGNKLSDGLDPSGYTEGPDGEKIPNRRGYAQSIAFLGVLKTVGKPIGNLSGKAAKLILKTEYPTSTAEKMLSTSLSMAGEMGSMMGTDQILSLSFDQKFKSVTAEDLITMFGMVAGLRLTNKVNMKFQQFDRKGVTIEMKKGGNTFNVKIDREGNVLKIDGKDNIGRKISNPGNELGIKSWDGSDAQNLRQTHEGREVGTVKGDIKQLNNLHEGDVITVKHGENDIKFKKNKSGNREIVDSGNITNERFNTGEEFVVKKNADGSGFHLESKFEGGPKITLDGKVRVKLGDRSSTIVDGNNGITAQRSEDNNRVSENVENNNNPIEDILKNKIVEDLYDKFDREIMSKDGITIDGITYKLERRPNEGHNPNRKGRVVYTEIGPDGKVIYKAEAHSNTFVLPENSNGNNIRNRFNAAREKYVNKNLNSALEPARQGLDSEVSKDIDSRTKDLEGKRKDKKTLELNKKSLSDEIDGLKSRKAQLEQQLQNISKELAQQTDIVSLNDIYSIIKPTHKISIGGKKMTFVGVKGNKIVFTEGKGKTREFSSFKELQDAGANFNIDIKSRQGEKGLEQQILFEELASKEARTSSANEIIKKYEELQRQKVQIENDIRDGYFRENAAKLKGKHIWIDGVEYQCTDIKTNNGRTTLDFKKTDGNEHFTISSFEQLKAKGQVNGFGDRYNVRDKESRAAGRELSQYERENYDLLRGENGLFKGKNKYVENKRQELQQINQQLENGKNDYNNAVQANRPRTVTNPEYERILKEIEGIDAQLVEKGQELVGIERDLGASNTEIARLEQEIRELTELRDNLSRIEYKNDIIDNNKQREELEMKVNDIKRFGKYNYEFKDIVENNLDRIINLEKIENIDSFMNESFEFLKKGMGIDDPGLKIKILEGTEGIDNHYDRSTNTVYFSRNFGGERQMYVKGGNKAEIFGGIGHELNHYLQETEIIKHYGKGNRDIDLFVDAILETANTEGLEMIERYRTQINHNEPISERAIRYAESYVKAGEDGTIFDHNGNILDYNKYRQLEYEKESFDKGDILAEEYRKATKSYKGEQQTFNQKGISTKEIQSRLDSDLIKLSNNQAFSDIKLDRATQETFKSGSFAQGIKNWIKEHINTPYFSVPKEYIKNIRYKLAENVTFWQNQLKLYFHEKLLPKYKSIKTRIGKKMENIDWEEVKNALDDLSDGLDNLKDLKDEINKHENSDNIETISTDVDGIIQIRENIIERFPDIEHIDGEHMDGGDMQIGHGENFIDPYQEDIGFDLYSYPDNIGDEFGLAA